MLLELLPELIDPILTLLSVKDLKNVSLCSKPCNHLVAPILWENVRVTSDHLFASTSVPSHIASSRHLNIDCYMSLSTRFNKADEQEFTKKLVALLKLTSLTTLSLFGFSELSIVTQCLATISELTSLENLKLSCCNISDAGLEHIGRLTGLVNLNISYNKKISDAGLEHLSYLTDLKNLSVQGCYISNAGLGHISP